MLKREDLIRRPNYLLDKYQNELFRQLKSYMEKEGLNQKQLASKLGVSDAYISQVLNGNFNFTLKKLLELSLMMDTVPMIEFVPTRDYLELEKQQAQNVGQTNQDSPIASKFETLFGPKSEEEQLELDAKVLHARFIKSLDGVLETLGVSQKEFAAKVGVSLSDIDQLFQGDRLVSIEILAKFQKALDFEYRVVVVQNKNNRPPSKDISKYHKFTPKEVSFYQAENGAIVA